MHALDAEFNALGGAGAGGTCTLDVIMTDHRILVGSACSPDDDRSQHPPVWFAGVEQGPDPVVLEVAEPEADPLDPLDQVVECLGRAVGDPGQVEVADLVEPVSMVRPSRRISGGMAFFRQCA